MRSPVRALAGPLLLLSAALAYQEGAPPPRPLDLKTPAPVPDGRIAKLPGFEKDSCAACHLEVAEEWSTTAHALAWLDPIYRDEIADKKKPEACHGCHIPQPLHLGEFGDKPEPRKASAEDPLEHGVSCRTCHLGPDGVILGPWGEPTPAHPSKKSETMVEGGSTALCSSCHRTNVGPVIGLAKDFESSNQAARGRSCVGCHWASVERVWANAPPDGSGLPAAEARPRMGRSHATQTPRDPAFLRQAFEPSVRVEGGKTVVTIRNATGHRVPGLIGRSLELTASVLDAGGKVLAEQKQIFDTRAHLPVDQAVELVLEAAGKEVRLVGRHGDPRLEEAVEFLDVRLTPAGR